MSKQKIMCGRSGMLGDTLAALPIATYCRKHWPDAQIIWPIGKKFAQAAPIYLNHPDIDQIFIFDGDERPQSQRDFDMIDSCWLALNPTPEHPDNIYPSQRNIYLETFLMAGFTERQWNFLTPEEQRPKLYKWWNDGPKVQKRTIAIWPCAGYGRENKRNPSQKWYFELINKLEKLDYCVCQFGHPNDFQVVNSFCKLNDLNFFEQIRHSLECDLIIGTDSGSQLILGAYEKPMISLLTNHWREDQDPHSLEVNNPNNYSFWAKGGADNILVDDVVAKVKDMVK